MNIIIPMAGLSSRFTREGFTLPKYMLYAKRRSLFNIAVSSFEKYFDTANFVFVARDVYDTPRFIEEECQLLGIKDYTVVVTEPTRGQAETVEVGVKKSGMPLDEPILIFNIDTFRPGFTLPECVDTCDGYLEVFKGSGANWSYARCAEDTDKVVETAEKKEISDNCSTGIYYFRSAKRFLNAYGTGEIDPNGNVKELYVAPLYNRLIAQGDDIRINVIPREEVIFCGVPQEYYDYLQAVVNE